MPFFKGVIFVLLGNGNSAGLPTVREKRRAGQLFTVGLKA